MIIACVTSLSTCYLLTLTSLPASVTLIYPTFSLDRGSEHRDNITADAPLVQYQLPPATLVMTLHCGVRMYIVAILLDLYLIERKVYIYYHHLFK